MIGQINNFYVAFLILILLLRIGYFKVIAVVTMDVRYGT
jgi:uncharacterized membrane protein